MVGRSFNAPLYGPQVKYGSTEAQRQQQLAQMLLKSGLDSSPTDLLGGIARIGTAGIGGYLQGKAGETEKAYQSDRTKALAAALSGNDPNQAAVSLLQNPSTADMGAQLALGNMTFNRDRAAKKEDFGMERGARLEDLYLTQGFQKEMAALQQAFAAGEGEKARGHAANLQKLQQDFTAGQQKSQQAFQAGENQLNRAAQTVPTGFRPTESGMAPIPGGPADPAYLGQKTEATAGGKMTDEQAKAAGFADRISNALPIIAATTGAGTDIKQKALSKLPVVGNFAVSDEYQKFDQAQRDIINAILRRESGAVIAESEFDNARKQYFPQPGDSTVVLQQKEKNLQEALQGMQRSAGPAYKKQEAPKTGIKFLGFE